MDENKHLKEMKYGVNFHMSRCRASPSSRVCVCESFVVCAIKYYYNYYYTHNSSYLDERSSSDFRSVLKEVQQVMWMR
jgi:hypothetical protein